VLFTMSCSLVSPLTSCEYPGIAEAEYDSGGAHAGTTSMARKTSGITTSSNAFAALRCIVFPDTVNRVRLTGLTGTGLESPD
jgi:hypothetical protein